jgi:hypothetical protein
MMYDLLAAIGALAVLVTAAVLAGIIAGALVGRALDRLEERYDARDVVDLAEYRRGREPKGAA